MKLYSPATVRQIVDKYEFHFQKSLGQNFLIDGNIVNKIVAGAGITEDDVVLEIGAGIGTLTRALAEKAAKVIVVELDKNLKAILEETLAGLDNVTIHWGNALKADFDQLVGQATGGKFGSGGRSYKVVANLPYYITTPLIMHGLENHFNISVMVFMIQKEVAERITASPGGKDYGALTVAINYYTEPGNIASVPRQVFIPQPEVDSTVIRLNRRSKPPVDTVNEDYFFKVVRAAFAQRRKTLSNNLEGLLSNLQKSDVAKLLEDLGIDPRRRGETLSLAEFAKIANAFYKIAHEPKL